MDGLWALGWRSARRSIRRSPSTWTAASGTCVPVAGPFSTVPAACEPLSGACVPQRIKDLQPEVSNRAIGRMLGVDDATVRRDAANAAGPAKDTARINETGRTDAANAAPALRARTEAKKRVYLEL